MVKVAINGFGRIGRMVLRAGINDPGIEWVAINDLTSTKELAYLFKYDTAQGIFDGTVEVGNGSLIVNGKEIKVTSEKFAEVTLDSDLSIADEKVKLGSASLTLRLFH